MIKDLYLGIQVENCFTKKDTCDVCGEQLILDAGCLSEPTFQIYCPNRYEGMEHTWLVLLRIWDTE